MIVTVSNEYGAAAVRVSARVAELLGYELVNQQLPVVVAQRLRISPEEVEAAEDEGRTLGERILSGFEVATPEVVLANSGETFDEACLREVQTAVREYEAHGNVVMMGRGAGVILGRRTDVLRVFLHAPREWRAHLLVDDLGVTEREAYTEIERVDRARRAYLRDWYSVDFGSPHLYDLSIDTSSFGIEGSAALVVAAVRARA